jgi:hypothetical protein
MPRLQVIVNPSGFWTTTERGFSTKWTGDELARRGLINMSDYGASSGFWNPPRSSWLLGRPYQFDAAWYRDALFGSYTHRQTSWSFAANVSANVSEFGFWDSPSEQFSHAQMMNFGQIPATLGTQPIAVNFTTLATAAGVTLPTGIGVVASTKNPQAMGATPSITWVRQPEPQDTFIFGFGQFAVIVTDRQTIVLQAADLGYQSWVRKANSAGAQLPQHSLIGNPLVASHQMQQRGLVVTQVGWNQLYLMERINSEPVIVTTRAAPTPLQKASGQPNQILGGPFWIAAAPGQKVLANVQTTAYRDANHITLGSGTVNDDTSKRWFDCTFAYPPSVAPQVVIDGIMHGTGNPVGTGITGGLQFLDPATLEYAEVQMVNHNHAAWLTGVGNFRGAFHVLLQASSGPNALSIYSPQIRSIEMRFAPVIVARSGTDTVLTDTQFKPIQVEASLADPEAKKLTIPLKPSGIAVLEAAGISTWDNVPVEVWEDSNDNGTADVKRAAGWITEPPSKGTHGPNYSDMVLTAQGMLLGRADRHFHYRHHLAAWSSGGRLLHTDAIVSTLLQWGFDVTSTSAVEFESDLDEDMVKYLPGPSEEPTESGEVPTSAYAPDWDETGLEYIRRIAEQWRKWLLYEGISGKIWYEHDVVDDLIDLGQTPSSEATFYLTHAAAAGAGAHQHQVYMAGLERWGRPPKANFIRIIPPKNTIPHVIDKDVLSATSTAAENYLGEYIPHIMQPKWAAADELFIARLAIVARHALRRFRRRVTGHHWRCLCAPWQVLPSGVDLNSVVTLQNLGLHRITHINVEQLSRDLFLTTWTAEKLPAARVF